MLLTKVVGNDDRDKVFVNTCLHLVLSNNLTIGHLKALTGDKVYWPCVFVVNDEVSLVGTSCSLDTHVRGLSRQATVSVTHLRCLLVFANEVCQ